MFDYFLDSLFILASLIVSVSIVAWYVIKLDKKLAYPHRRIFSDWVFQAYLSPFRTINRLYGKGSSAESKDLIGFVLFGIVFFVSSHVLYFRDAFFTTETFYYYIILLIAFFIMRMIFVTLDLLHQRPTIEAIGKLFQERIKMKKKRKELETSRIHLNKRHQTISRLHLKWQKIHERKTADQRKLEHTITKEKARVHEKWETLAENLEKIEALEPTTIIAVDSNVLMKADDYLIDAISRFPILISKHVQQEWDKNKMSDHREKAFRARQAIRRLVNLPHYTFTVSKWRNDFLREHDLLKGVPDDEIIADYLYELKQGKELIVLSDDLNFIASAQVHMPVLSLKNMDIFS